LTLLSGAALAALVLIVPLVALHLRRRKEKGAEKA